MNEEARRLARMAGRLQAEAAEMPERENAERCQRLARKCRLAAFRALEHGEAAPR